MAQNPKQIVKSSLLFKRAKTKQMIFHEVRILVLANERDCHWFVRKRKRNNKKHTKYCSLSNENANNAKRKPEFQCTLFNAFSIFIQQIMRVKRH